jgi:uncharacterized protein GlcG (DUF336 family)
MPTYTESVAISHTSALELVQAVIDEGARRGIAVVVTVVDPGMNPVAAVRSDGTTPHSVETSRRKACTSASTRRATGYLAGELAVQLPMGTGNLLTNIQGGLPLTFDGRHLGGLGVAGGPPAQDAEIAAAVLAALGYSVPES